MGSVVQCPGGDNYIKLPPSATSSSSGPAMHLMTNNAFLAAGRPPLALNLTPDRNMYEPPPTALQVKCS